MKPHPAANMFPMMSDDALDALIDDIREHGQREPIVLHDGKILDGRNRWRACEEAGVEPITVEWDGACGSPTSFVLSLNLHRRHLDTSQRAIVGAYAEKLFAEEAKERQRTGGANGAAKRDGKLPANLPEPSEHSMEAREQAAAEVNVSPRTIQDAKKVVDEGAEELVDAVRAGELTIGAAIHLVDLPKEEQAALAKNPSEAKKKAAAKRSEKSKPKPKPAPVERAESQWDVKSEVAKLRAFVRDVASRWQSSPKDLALVLDQLAREVESSRAA